MSKQLPPSGSTKTGNPAAWVQNLPGKVLLLALPALADRRVTVWVRLCQQPSTRTLTPQSWHSHNLAVCL